MKEILKAIFCPIWFLIDHNIDDKIGDSNNKNKYFKFLFIIPIAAIIVFLVYIKEIF